MLQSQRIINSLLLFHCRACHERFVTFHPNYEPSFALDCLATYPWKVQWFDNDPTERTKFADLHTGFCKRCFDQADKVKDNEDLKGIGLWSAENNMHLLHGLSLTKTEKEFRELHEFFLSFCQT